jgi:hypothetical protein
VRYPPFGRLASLLVTGADKHGTEASHASSPLQRRSPRSVRVLGPAEAPLAVVRGRHRFRLMVKSARNFDLPAYLRGWLASAPKRKGDVNLGGRCRSAEFLILFPLVARGGGHEESDDERSAPTSPLMYWAPSPFAGEENQRRPAASTHTDAAKIST